MRLRYVLIPLCCALVVFCFWSASTRSGTDAESPAASDARVAQEQTGLGDAPSTFTASNVTPPAPAQDAPQGAAIEVRPPMLPQRPNLPRMIPPSLPGAVLVSPAPTVAGQVSPEEVAGDVDKITLSLRDYRTVMRENPVGTNAEITSALNGGNPRQARLLPEGQAVNDGGEMIDRWGTPYFFHQLSRDYMEIRSAGPDKIMWTPDDTVSN